MEIFTAMRGINEVWLPRLLRGRPRFYAPSRTCQKHVFNHICHILPEFDASLGSRCLFSQKSDDSIIVF